MVEQATGTGDLAPDSARATAPTTATGLVTAAAGTSDQVSFTLPATGSVNGVKSGQGTVTYPNAAADGADLAVQPTDDGIRALVTIKDADAPREYRFPLTLPQGATAEAQADGSVAVVKDGGRLGAFSAPWAKDAVGKPVQTSYRIDGDTLVQTVAFNSDTSFPVVADPHYTWGIITGTIYFNKSETKDLALGAGAAVAILGAVTKVTPLTVSGIALTAAANIAINHGQCVKVSTASTVGMYSGKAGDGYCK